MQADFGCELYKLFSAGRFDTKKILENISYFDYPLLVSDFFL